MPYLIDGHNLIPKIPGLSLEQVDDEQRLLELLQEFCRKTRKQVEVFFDNAPPNGVRARNLGLVTARFIRQGSSADEAIRKKLERLAGEARNWTVVSSDLAVQTSARHAQAQVLSSDNFAKTLFKALGETLPDKGSVDEPSLSQEEIDDWLTLFGGQ